MTKRTTRKPEAKPVEGYKGHKAGSRIGELHKCFDQKGADAARELGEKLGLCDATLKIQFSRYRKATGGKKAAKAKKPVTKPSKPTAETRAAV